MRSVLDVEGPAYRGLSRWAELAILSVAWWVLSLPMITAPVATGWLMAEVRQIRAGHPISGPRATGSYLRRRFGVSLRLAGIQLVVAALVAVALLGPSPGGWYGQLVFGVGCLVGITSALVAPWAVALLDRHTTARAAVRAAYRQVLGQLSLAFLSAVAVAGGVAAVLFAPGWMQLIVMLAAPGLTVAVVTRLCDLAEIRTLSPTSALEAPALDDHRLGKAS